MHYVRLHSHGNLNHMNMKIKNDFGSAKFALLSVAINLNIMVTARDATMSMF